jgi:hypothetical protein
MKLANSTVTGTSRSLCLAVLCCAVLCYAVPIDFNRGGVLFYTFEDSDFQSRTHTHTITQTDT